MAPPKASNHPSISRFFPSKKRLRTEAELSGEAVKRKEDEPEVIVLDDSDSDDGGVIFSRNEPPQSKKPPHSPESQTMTEDALEPKMKSMSSNINVSFMGATFPADDEQEAQQDDGPAEATSAAQSQGDRPAAATPVAQLSSTTNPFEGFAFQEASSSPKKQSDLSQWIKKAPTTKKSASQNTKPRTFHAGGKDWIKVEDLPTNEQERIMKKWHSLVDPQAPLEDRRFQLLVAARLHARCQEPSVRQAMKQLCLAFDGKLTVQAMAKADAGGFEGVISNLQYYPTKAKHLVKAANEIMTQFGGCVPESESDLKKLTGIGPVLADMLAFVNTRAKHRKKEQKSTN